MKTNIIALFILVLTLCCSPSFASKSAETNSSVTNSSILMERLVEIRELDKTSMSYSQKKILRMEVKSIKTAMRSDSGGGIYISVGAAILIVLILILLF